MKTIKYFLFFAIGLVALNSCDTNDDGFYNAIYLDSDTNDLVAIENRKSEYSTSDSLYVISKFSRYQNEKGQTKPLDIYKTTGGAAAFNFSYVLEIKNGADWEVVKIPTEVLKIKKGKAVSGDFVYGSCVYNSTNKNDEYYEYHVGMPLSKTGDYRFRFGYNSDSNKVELVSESLGTNLAMVIFSPTSNLNAERYYTFTVK